MNILRNSNYSPIFFVSAQCTSSSEKTYIGEKYQLFLLLSVCYVKCCNYYYYYYYFYKVEDKTVNIPPPPSPSSLIIDPSPSHIKCLCFSILYSTCVLFSVHQLSQGMNIQQRYFRHNI